MAGRSLADVWFRFACKSMCLIHTVIRVTNCFVCSAVCSFQRMAHRKMFSRLSNFMFHVFCGCGLFWQLVLLFNIYFHYKVTTFIAIASPAEIPPIATSFCSRYTDLLDFTRLNSETGRNWNYTVDGDTILTYQNEIRVSEIFKYTPAVNVILKGLMVRDYVSIKNVFYNKSSDINRLVAIKKFVYMEFVCYEVKLRHDKTMPHNYYAVTPSMPGMMYKFELSSVLDRMNAILIVLHKSSESQLRSLSHNRFIAREYEDANRTAVYSAFNSVLDQVDMNLLPSPYESDCYDYSPQFRSEVECTQTCVMQHTLQQVNRVPVSIVLTDKTINNRIVSMLGMNDQKLVEKVNRIESMCSNDVCKRRHCFISESTTTTRAFKEAHYIIINVPSQAWMEVEMRPEYTLVEFLTYVVSTVSIWTGLSIISFSPKKCSRMCNKWTRRRRRFLLKSRNIQVQPNDRSL